MSRLAMSAAQMAGAAVAGIFVAAAGPGWALATCGIGMLGSVPLLLAIRSGGNERLPGSNMLREIRDGWSEFRSHTWLWVIVAQYGVILAAWYGSFEVLGPVVARAHLGGPAAWGAITAAESVGLIAGGLASLRFSPRRPMLNIPRAKLARVSAYDALGSVIAMPVGAVVAGPVAAAIGVSATDYGAVAVIVVVSALALIPREVRSMRAGDVASGHDGPQRADPAGPGVSLPGGGEPFVRPAGRTK